MKKCFTTKLSAIVNNSNLRKSGEARVTFRTLQNPTSTTQVMNVNFSQPTTMEIVGNGYFTDSTLSANQGKTKNLPAGASTLYFSNGSYEVKFDKTHLVAIGSGSLAVTDTEKRHAYGGNLSEFTNCTELLRVYFGLSYMTGDIANLKNSTNITIMNFDNSDIYGDIANLSGMMSLQEVHLNNLQSIRGNISVLSNKSALTYIAMANTGVTGDISALANKSALTFLQLHMTNVYGNISALAASTLLTTISVYNSNVSGDVGSIGHLSLVTVLNIANTGISGTLSSLGGMSALRGVYCHNASGLTGGNLALMPAGFYYIESPTNALPATWTTTRPSASSIISMNRVNFGNQVDTVLNNLANCAINANDAHKIISLIGTRTSASDAAVTTLRSKGYTVTLSAS